MGATSRVVIGMDPHKRTVTIEAMSPDEAVVGRGRFTTDVAGFEAMLADYKHPSPPGKGGPRWKSTTAARSLAWTCTGGAACWCG